MVIRIMSLIVLFTASMVGTAFAIDSVGGLPDSTEAIVLLLKQAAEALVSGQYALGVVVLLIAGVAAIRRYGGNRFPWLASSSGAAVIAVLFTLLATLSAGLATGQALSAGLLYAGLIAAVGAAGTYSLAHELLAPLLRKIDANGPVWAKPIVGVLLWLLDRPDNKAEKAGNDAVEAKPSTGLAGVVGEPRDVE